MRSPSTWKADPMDGTGARSPFLLSRGLRIPKHPQITIGRIRGALRDGTYERKECDAVTRVVRPGDRVLELGGGIGYVSALLAVIELHPRWIGQSGVQAVFDTMHRAGLTYFPKASEGKVVTFRRGW